MPGKTTSLKSFVATSTMLQCSKSSRLLNHLFCSPHSRWIKIQGWYIQSISPLVDRNPVDCAMSSILLREISLCPFRFLNPFWYRVTVNPMTKKKLHEWKTVQNSCQKCNNYSWPTSFSREISHLHPCLSNDLVSFISLFFYDPNNTVIVLEIMCHVYHNNLSLNLIIQIWFRCSILSLLDPSLNSSNWTCKHGITIIRAERKLHVHFTGRRDSTCNFLF